LIIFSLFILFIHSLLLSEEILFFDNFENDIVGQPPTNWYTDSTDTILVIDDYGNNCLLIEEDSEAIIQNFSCPFQYTIQVKWKAPVTTDYYYSGIEIPPGFTFYYGTIFSYHGLFISDPMTN
ncbi:MAG: hypothetical protein KAT74_08435, partial [Candidatus Cloacimonetes bacterium]|nr:hypothetical protein [Candidatus Cloacimonadota bacterium]